MNLTSKSLRATCYQQLQYESNFRVHFHFSRALLIPVLLIYLFSATIFVNAQDSSVSMGTSYGGSSYIDGELVEASAINDVRNEQAPSGSYSHAVVFSPANKGLAAKSRPGYLHASVGSSSFDSGLSSVPRRSYGCGGSVMVFFEDRLTLRGLGVGSLPENVLVRVTWRAKGSMTYQSNDPDAIGGCDYFWQCAQNSGAPVTREGRIDTGHIIGDQPSLTTSTEGLSPTTVTAPAAASFSLSAELEVHAVVSERAAPMPTLTTSDAAVSLEVLFIEVIDPATNKHLAVTATAASGQNYPIVQPSVPGVPFGITAMLIERDIGRGFLSFSSISTGNFRILGGSDFSNLQLWQELAVVSGSPGINIAYWNDPDTSTQSSRFYIVEKLPE